MKRAALLLALAPVLAAPATAALADTVPPPPASASASALDVAGVISAGQTSASAGPTDSSATASALSLGGNTLSEGQTGGSTKSGKASGAIFDSGATPLGSLAITPWSVSAEQGKASSDAAVARLTVIDPNTVAVNVLQSHSDATYDNSASKGSSSSDGATVMLGGGALYLQVLHAEATSGQNGSSYLVGINGNLIGSSDQANGQCVIDIPGLLHLVCLSATGGKGSTTSTAAVATAQLAGGQLPTGTVSGVTSTGGPAPAAAAPAKTSVKGERVPNTGKQANQGGQLPFTGFPALVLVALAAVLSLAGGLLQKVRASQA
jgi:hypothetical protein